MQPEKLTVNLDGNKLNVRRSDDGYVVDEPQGKWADGDDVTDQVDGCEAWPR